MMGCQSGRKILAALAGMVCSVIGNMATPSRSCPSLGKSDYVIVQNASATEPEKFAAKELGAFLEKVTGAKFAAVAENGAAPAKTTCTSLVTYC